jgi:GT2 family glycosyltransferase
MLSHAAKDHAALEPAHFDEVADDFARSLAVFAPVIAEHKSLVRSVAERETAERRRGEGLAAALQKANHELALSSARCDTEAERANTRESELEVLRRRLVDEEVRAYALAGDVALREKKIDALLADLRTAELKGGAAANLALERAEEIARIKTESAETSALLLAAETLARQQKTELMRVQEEADDLLRQCRVLEARVNEAELRAERAQDRHSLGTARIQVLEAALSRARTEAQAERMRADTAEEAEHKVTLLEQQNAELHAAIAGSSGHVAALEESVRALKLQVEAETEDRIGYAALAESQASFIENARPFWRKVRETAWRNTWMRPLSASLEFVRIALLSGPERAYRVLAASRFISASDLFDADYYLRHSWDVRSMGIDPAIHYSEVGYREGRDPSPLFSTLDYLTRYPDVAQSGGNPLVHFMRHGRKEGRIARGEREIGASRGSDEAGAATDDADPYRLRPDASVREEAARGARYMALFRLDSDAPDFAGAVAALNAMRVESSAEPTVSIIIPVYGQLAFTLNCLHSLLSHSSSHSFEVLIVDDCSPDESSTWIRRVAGVRLISRPSNGGFISACNEGAAHARGRFFVFLNNDTRVVGGWLDALVDSLQRLPNADVVGSKLFFPDGSLQEAGGLIWSDGSAWNFGRGDDPGRPEYCYARPVDYVSGASLAISREAWLEIGGFDQRYSPAYCEDADLCLKVRYQRNREVWFQPQSRAIHYEGKTSGTDLKHGAKAHQIGNTETLRRVWAQHLAAHRKNGERPLLEKDRGVRKRALVIEATTPEPDKDAGSVTCVAMMAALQEAGFKVSFAPEDNMLFIPGPSGALQRIGVEVLYAPFEMTLHEVLQRRCDEFDLVLAFRFGVTEKYVETLRRTQPRAPIVMHCSDLHFLREARHADLVGDPVLQFEAEETQRRELEVIKAVDVTIVHSSVERDILATSAPDSPVCVFPFIQDVTSRSVPFSMRRDIAFLGGYRHRPNVDAVKSFVERIWPLIRARDSQIRFLIAGSECPPEIMRLSGSENIEVVGFVRDLDEFFAGVRLSVAPIRYGAGVKGKVATALAHGVPTVLTSCAVEGMGLKDGEAVLIRDNDVDFAEAVVTLYNDERLWTTMSADALALVAKNFSTASTRHRMTELLELAHSSKKKHRSPERRT